MAKIPREVIEDIQNRVDIVDLINRYVPLKRAGQNFKGSCPFHKENTPSFIVSPKKQIYHCFGCHAGGTVYSFIMEYDKINFVEAVKKISHEVGIDVNRYLNDRSFENTKRGKMYEINAFASSVFQKALQSNLMARNYLESRYVPEDIVEKFSIGYSPEAWDHLVKQLPKEDHAIATELGLLAQYENKPPYDKFRNRLIFPIFSTSNQILGFGGRRFNEEQNPKYLNSPESEIYSKRHILFGLSHAIDAIRKHEFCYLVEGYMDVIRCHQYGIENVVASSGTALTDGHARLLSRYCKKIIVMFDSDNAGIDAAVRSIPILLKQNFSMTIVPMPKGSDPDTILLKKGREAFEQFVSKGYDFIDFQVRLYSKRNQLMNNEGKRILVGQILEQIQMISDDILKEIYLNEYNKSDKLFGFDLRSFKTLPQSHQFSEEKPEQTENKISQYMAYISAPEYNKELKFVGWIIHSPENIQTQILHHLRPSFFKNKILRRIVEKIIIQFDDDGKIDLHELINEDSSQLFGKIISSFNETEYQNSEQFIHDALISFKFESIDTEIRELLEHGTNEDLLKITELQKERDKLAQERHHINTSEI